MVELKFYQEYNGKPYGLNFKEIQTWETVKKF